MMRRIVFLCITLQPCRQADLVVIGHGGIIKKRKLEISTGKFHGHQETKIEREKTSSFKVRMSNASIVKVERVKKE